MSQLIFHVSPPPPPKFLDPATINISCIVKKYYFNDYFFSVLKHTFIVFHLIFRIKVGEKQYMDAFDDELSSFKDRIRDRAQARIDAAMKEYEEVSFSAYQDIFLVLAMILLYKSL